MSLKLGYTRYSDIPNCCETCMNRLSKGGDLKTDVCMCKEWTRCELANYHGERGHRNLNLNNSIGYRELAEHISECPHWIPNIVCGDCKYAVDGRYHDERIGFCTFRCACTHKTVMDISPACKRYKVKGGDST